MLDPRRTANIIRKDGPKLFGKLLWMLMEKADLTQQELEERALAHRKAWAGQGFFKEAESGDLSQTAISQAINGKLKKLSYGQTFIWLYVVGEALKASGHDFPEDLESDMFRLVRHVPPREIVSAYDLRKSLAPKSTPKRGPKKEK